MSDTIVVMNQGYIQQMGSPEQIYNEPETHSLPTSSARATSWTV